MNKPNVSQKPQEVKFKKTALDYVRPHNHNAVPLALDFAKQDWFGERVYGIIEYVLELGGTKGEIARRTKVDRSQVSHWINEFGGSK